MNETAYRPAEPQAALERDLEALYRSWRILDLVGETVDRLPPGWLQVLNIARNLRLRSTIPGVEIPETLTNIIAGKPEYTVTVRTERKRRLAYAPSDDRVMQPLRNVGDLPQVTLPDMLLHSLSPELFEYRLLSGNIHGLYDVASDPTVEEWDEIVEERRPSDARRRRQRVYVLLDVSNSMREANKIVFAKALVLAYLLTAAEERAQIYFRTFANSVHARTDCTERDHFAELARRVLTVTPEGSTDMRAAVAAALGDIAALDGVGTKLRPFEQSPTELLLISDCESYSVPQIPKGVRLHTVHLKGGEMLKGYQEGFDFIRRTSDTFHEIETTRFELPDTTRDRWLLLQDGRTLETTVAIATEDGRKQHEERLRRRQALLAAYQRMSPGEHRKDAVKGRERTYAASAPSVLDVFAPWRRLMAALRRALAHLPWHRQAAVAPVVPGFGVQFRPRR